MAQLNIGEKAEVIGMGAGRYHGYKIGSKITIKDHCNARGYYTCSNGIISQLIHFEDLKPINSNQTNMDELKITKQRVLDAAARCGTAKATLETLFPEAFQSANCIPLEKQVFKSINGDGILTTPCWREGYENLIALNDRYDYKLTMGPLGLSQYLRVTPK